jgi:1,4-dihydroxy-2-naphthoyl-CoA synthase
MTEEMLARVEGSANTIAGNAPMTIATIKRTTVESEGRTAFREKRKPQFHGR